MCLKIVVQLSRHDLKVGVEMLHWSKYVERVLIHQLPGHIEIKLLLISSVGVVVNSRALMGRNVAQQLLLALE